MGFECREDHGVTVVVVGGPLEVKVANADRFRDDLLATLGDARVAVLDASAVEFFDSAGMGSLLAVQRALEKRGGRLALAGLSRQILEVFQMIGFDMVFPIHPDVAAAVADLGGDR